MAGSRTKKRDIVAPADDADATGSQGEGQATPQADDSQAGAVAANSGDAPSGDGSDPLAGMEAMPAIQPHAIEAEKQDEAEKTAHIESAASGLTDANGRTFDPAIHETGPDGAPRLSPTGKLRLKRGRGASSFSGTKQPLNGTTPKQTAQAANVQTSAPKATAAEIEMAAKSTMNLIFMGSMMVFGPEDGELTKDELSHGVQTFTSYYETRGIIKVPPEVAVIAYVATLGVSRWNRPRVAERRRSFKEKFIVWWLRMRGKKAKPVEADTTDDELTDTSEAKMA
jgi:hypothetical protein